jgi:hypothetical protein
MTMAALKTLLPLVVLSLTSSFGVAFALFENPDFHFFCVLLLSSVKGI